jgi:hypothetical protein
MKEYFMKKTVAVLLAFGMAMSAVSCGAQNDPQGIWTGEDSYGDAFSAIFIGSQVFLPDRENFGDFNVYIPAITGTFTFEKNAGICRFADRDGQDQVAIPFTISGTSMRFGSVSATGASITLAKDTGTFSIPADIGGIWTSRDGDDAGFVFINNIVYAHENGDSVKGKYTYSKGSVSISLGDPPQFFDDFTVSGNTLTSTWRGSPDPFVFTRQ